MEVTPSQTDRARLLAPVFQSKEEYSEAECQGVIELPANARICRSQFSLEALQAAEPDDAQLIGNVIAYCSHEIARKHQQVRAVIGTDEPEHRGDWGRKRTREYRVALFMPREVTLDWQAAANLIQIHPRLVYNWEFRDATDGIPEDAPPEPKLLLVYLYSHCNAWLPESVTLIHTIIRCQRLVTYEKEPNESVSLKRPRSSG